MKKLLKFACLVSAAFGLTAARADVFVSGTGDDGGAGTEASPYRTLTKAFESAGAGGVVRVGAGTYDAEAGETFPITVAEKAVSFLPWEGNGTTETRIVDGGNEADTLMIVRGVVSPVTVKGLTFRNSNKDPLEIDGCYDATVEDCAFAQSKNNDSNGGGVFAKRLTTVTVRNCLFSGFRRRGALLMGADKEDTKDGPTVTVEGCTFSSLTNTWGSITCMQTLNTASRIKYKLTVTDTLFANCTTHNDSQSRSDSFVSAVFQSTSRNDNNYKGDATFDRCRFVGNSGAVLFGLENMKNMTISNSLFADNGTFSKGTFYGYNLTAKHYNNSFVRNEGCFSGRSINAEMYNCLFKDVGDLAQEMKSGETGTIKLYNTLLDNTGYGLASKVLENGTILRAAANLDGEDRPRPFSAAVDAGDNAKAQGDFDLTGVTARKLDNTGAGAATVDLGCYESTFGAASVPTFTVSNRGYSTGFFGAVFTFELGVSPAPATDGPYAFEITAPAGVNCEPASGTVAKGGKVTVTVTTTGGAPSGESALTIASTDGAGIASERYTLVLAPLSVRLVGDTRRFVGKGETVAFSFKSALEGTDLPDDIEFSAEISGGGTASLSTEGGITVTGGEGVNTLTITTTQGVFAETGTASVDVSIVSTDGYLYVDPVNGDDTTETGAVGAPFRTITAALAAAPAGMTLRLMPGAYSASSNGETFPILPHGVVLEGWTDEGEVDREWVVIDGGNACDHAVRFVPEDVAFPNAGVRNCWIRETKNAAVYVDIATVEIRNVLFTQTVKNNDVAGGVMAYGQAHVTARGCTFREMKRRGAYYFNADSAVSGTDRFIKAVDCEFIDNESSYGAVFTHSRNCTVFLEGCLFRGNTATSNGNGVHDSYAGSALLLYGNGDGKPQATISRCRFEGNGGEQLFAAEYTPDNGIRVDNSVFVSNEVTRALSLGYSCENVFRNCTFSGNTPGYWAGRRMKAKFYNCIYLDEGPIAGTPSGTKWGEDGGDVKFGQNLFFTDNLADALGASAKFAYLYPSVDQLNADPVLGADLVPKAYSPALDAGRNGDAAGETDLAGNRRISANLGEPATVDLGAFESTWGDAASPALQFSGRNYLSAILGGTETVTVSIKPAPAEAATVTFAYPEGVTGPASVTLDAGNGFSAPVELGIAAGAPAACSVTAMWADGSAVLDIATSSLDLTVGGRTTLFCRAGDTAFVTVGLALDGALSPADIPVAFEKIDGDATFAWEGDVGENAIAKGAHAAAARLKIDNISGTSHVKISSSAPFVENGQSEIVLEIIASSGVVYVGPNGDDSDTDGTAEKPFGTIAGALAVLSSGEELRLMPGTYGSDAVAYPLQLHGVRLVGAGAPGETVLDGGNAVNSLLTFSALDAQAGQFVANVTLRNTKGALIDVCDCALTVSNCVFTQSAGQDNGKVGGASVYGDVHFTAVDCVFEGIRRKAVIDLAVGSAGDGTRSTTLRRCVFRDNVSYNAAINTYPMHAYTLTVDGCSFLNNGNSQNEYTPHDAYSGSAMYLGMNQANVSVHATRFEGNGGNTLFGMQIQYNSQNRCVFSDCLFVTNAPTYAMISGYNATPTFANCTSVRNAKGIWCGRNVRTTFVDSVFYEDAPVVAYMLNSTKSSNNTEFWKNSLGNVTFTGLNALYRTEIGELTKANFTADAILGDDPIMDEAWRLKPYSPYVDMAEVRLDLPETDFEGKRRLADSTGAGGPRLDLGCYEQDYADSDVAMFHVPDRAIKSVLRGGSGTLAVTVVPAPASGETVTAALAATAGITVPATVEFTAANGYAAEIAYEIDGAAPEAGTITLATAAGSAALAKSAYLDLKISDVELEIAGGRRYVRTGAAVEIPISMLNGVPAPEAIGISVVNVTGGSSTAAFGGAASTEIAAGATATAVPLTVTGGEGVTTLTLAAEGAKFHASGENQLTITVVAYDGELWVDAANGDDDANVGYADAPLKTIAAALGVAKAGDTLKLKAGTYGPSGSGDAFPIQPGGVSLAGAEEGVVLDGGNGPDNILEYGTQAQGGRLDNLVFSNSVDAAVKVSEADLEIAGCVFGQDAASFDRHGGVSCLGICNVSLADCVFAGFTRKTAVYCESSTLDEGRCSLALSRCTFAGLTVSMASVGIKPNSLYTLTAAECEFNGNNTPQWTEGESYKVHDAYAATAFYIANGGYFDPPGGSRVDRSVSSTIERCRFIGGTGNHVIAGEYNCIGNRGGATLSNCLFDGCQAYHNFLLGYTCKFDFRNCTFVNCAKGFASRNVTTILRNCIVSGTTKLHDYAERSEWTTSQIGSLELYDTLVWNSSFGEQPDDKYAISNMIEEDPLFRKAETGDYRLASKSPAVNAGNNDSVVGETDLLGAPRIMRKTVDLGCYECELRPGVLILIR